MKNLNSKQKRIVKEIKNSKGRFFGLETKGGEVFNAQFRGETAQFIKVYDRNYSQDYKVKKTNIASFKLGDTSL